MYMKKKYKIKRKLSLGSSAGHIRSVAGNRRANFNTCNYQRVDLKIANKF